MFIEKVYWNSAEHKGTPSGLMPAGLGSPELLVKVWEAMDNVDGKHRSQRFMGGCTSFSALLTDNCEAENRRGICSWVASVAVAHPPTQPTKYTISWPRRDCGLAGPRALFAHAPVSWAGHVFACGAWPLCTTEGSPLACIVFH